VLIFQFALNSPDLASTTSPCFPGFRQLLFNRQHCKKRKSKRTECWTAQFLCLSSCSQEKVPNSSEKEVLRKAGIGLKKIRLNNLDNEEAIVKLLQSDEKDEHGEFIGFPQLQHCGGFELLRTQQNGRTLSLLPGPWTSKELKLNVGCQARIYIRPIQKSLSTSPLFTEEPETLVKVACGKCQMKFPVQELRRHVEECGTFSDSELQYLPETHSESCLPFCYLLSNNTISTDNTDGATVSCSSSQDGLVSSDQQTSETNQYAYISCNDSVHVNNSDRFPVLSFSTQDALMEENKPNEMKMSLPAFVNSSIPSEHEQAGVCRDITQGNGNEINKIIVNIISFCKENNIDNPVEILRKLQQEIVCGRPLEVEDPNETIEGETNYIAVDRENILYTGMDEINAIPVGELRKTLEVQFYNEVKSYFNENFSYENYMYIPENINMYVILIVITRNLP